MQPIIVQKHILRPLRLDGIMEKLEEMARNGQSGSFLLLFAFQNASKKATCDRHAFDASSSAKRKQVACLGGGRVYANSSLNRQKRYF